jgi:hypothetical protein
MSIIFLAFMMDSFRNVIAAAMASTSRKIFGFPASAGQEGGASLVDFLFPPRSVLLLQPQPLHEGTSMKVNSAIFGFIEDWIIKVSLTALIVSHRAPRECNFENSVFSVHSVR